MPNGEEHISKKRVPGPGSKREPRPVSQEPTTAGFPLHMAGDIEAAREQAGITEGKPTPFTGPEIVATGPTRVTPSSADIVEPGISGIPVPDGFREAVRDFVDIGRDQAQPIDFRPSDIVEPSTGELEQDVVDVGDDLEFVQVDDVQEEQILARQPFFFIRDCTIDWRGVTNTPIETISFMAGSLGDMGWDTGTQVWKGQFHSATHLVDCKCLDAELYTVGKDSERDERGIVKTAKFTLGKDGDLKGYVLPKSFELFLFTGVKCTVEGDEGDFWCGVAFGVYLTAELFEITIKARKPKEGGKKNETEKVKEFTIEIKGRIEAHHNDFIKRPCSAAKNGEYERKARFLVKDLTDERILLGIAAWITREYNAGTLTLDGREGLTGIEVVEVKIKGEVSGRYDARPLCSTKDPEKMTHGEWKKTLDGYSTERPRKFTIKNETPE